MAAFHDSSTPTSKAALGLSLGLVASGWDAAALLLAPLLAWRQHAGAARPVATALLAGLFLGFVLTASPASGPDVPEGIHRVEGTVLEAPPPGDTGLDADFRIEAIGDARLPRACRLVVRLQAPAARGLALHAGTRLRAVGRLSRRTRLRNPGSPRGPPSWRFQVRTAGAITIVRPADGPAATVERLRWAAGAALDRHLARPDAALAHALLLGDRSALRPRERARFRRTGQGHLLAVSGLHVGLVLAGALVVLRPLGVGLTGRAVVVLLLLAVYVPLTGAPPSAVRAGGAAALYAAGRLVLRDARAGSALATVVLWVLLLDPPSASSAAFALSVAAVVGILVLAPVLSRWFVGPSVTVPDVVAPPRAFLRRSFAVALAAWLATTPLLASAFGRVALVAAPLSVLTVPLTAGLLASGALALVAGGVLALPFTTLAFLLRGLLDLVIRLGGSAGRVDPPGVVWVAAWVLGLLALAAGTRRAAVLLVVLLVLLFTPRARTTPPDPRLVFLEGGRGRAAVLFVPDGRVALLDVGRRAQGGVGRRVLVPALAALGVERLDLLVLTGRDAEDAGGLEDVLAALPVGRVVTAPAALDGTRRRGGADGPPVRAAVGGDVLLGGPWGRLVVTDPGDGGGNEAPAGLTLLLARQDGPAVLLPAAGEGSAPPPGPATRPRRGRLALVLPPTARTGVEGRSRLVASDAALRLASCGPEDLRALPPGTRATAAEGALRVDLLPGGARVMSPWSGAGEEYDPPRSMPPPAPPTFPWIGAGLLACFAVIGVRPLRWLDAGASLAALLLGLATLLAFSGPGLAALFAPFLVATLVGRLPGHRHLARTWRQVVANGVVPLAGALVALGGHTGTGFALWMGGLAFLGADTCATEIGVRYGGPPRHALTGRPVPRGQSGGITVAGTLAAVAGAALAPLALALAGALAPRPAGLFLFAGFAAQVADSMLGATLQWHGRSAATGRLTERREPGAATLSGVGWIDNDVVNLMGSAVAAALAWVLMAAVA